LSKTAASLQRVQESTGLKTVVLTGLVASEDNARAAIELSIALAAGPARVLLVDAALEPPFPDRLIAHPPGLGPANPGRGTGSAAPLISVAPTLDLAPIGAHVLAGREPASTAAGTLASRYGAHYDWIVLRGPVLSSEEATQAVRHLGAGVVFLIDGTSAFPEVGRHIALIGRDRVVATVLVGLSDVKR
jgi:hypothetical protein